MVSCVVHFLCLICTVLVHLFHLFICGDVVNPPVLFRQIVCVITDAIIPRQTTFDMQPNRPTPSTYTTYTARKLKQLKQTFFYKKNLFLNTTFNYLKKEVFDNTPQYGHFLFM